MSFSHDNKLELRSFRRLKSYIATFSRPHLCAIPPTLVGWLFKQYDVFKYILRGDELWEELLEKLLRLKKIHQP